jgi:2-C-methyl-D-erythritol 4-phosphate cytidylyltransferase
MMLQNSKVVALIAAGGTGSRLGEPRGKQLLEIAGKPIVAWSTQAVCDIAAVDEVIVVCDPSRVEQYSDAILAHVTSDIPITFIGGADTRAASVRCGLDACNADLDGEQETDGGCPDEVIVLIHDGARPLATSQMMAQAVEAFADSPDAKGLVVGHPVSDTLKHVDEATVLDTPDRARYWAVQTPQIFRLSTLRDAYAYASEHHVSATDDSSLVEAAGHRVVVHRGPRDNIKVTAAEDVAFVEAALKARSIQECAR